MTEKNTTKTPYNSQPQHSKVFQLQIGQKKAPTVDPLLPQFLRVQSELNNQLFKNQMLLQKFLIHQRQPQPQNPPQKAPNINHQNILILPNPDQKMPSEQPEQLQPKKKRISKVRKLQSSGDQYQPSDEGDVAAKSYKVSETKNIPKNFGKAILRFMRKNEPVTSEVLTQYGYNFKKFHQMMDSYRDKINTIAQLRSLWIDDQNEFAQALRVLSAVYLRKYSLKHIFNSRVENHTKHIKYRQKIMKALENPKEFTYIKDF